MTNLMFQTCDASRYVSMLDVTKQINSVYATRHGLEYTVFVGLKRGFHPWHAAFNRILMLKEFASDPKLHWAFYLDADAYVFDLSFDLEKYLTVHADRALIIGQGSNKGGWDVNTGVFFLNLRHPIGQEIVATWNDIFMSEVSDDDLRQAAKPFDFSMHDQTILQRMLRTDHRLYQATFVESRRIINSRASSFVRQIVRTADDTVETRTQRAKDDIAKVMDAVTPT